MSKRTKSQLPIPEWSHPVDVSELAAKPLSMHIQAGAQELRALAARLNVVSVEDAQADMTFARDEGNLIVHVKGTVKARVTQNCVVTLESVKDEISEHFDAWFADPEQAVSFTKARHDRAARKGNTEMPILEESDDPEPIIDGEIDAGELATQFISLAINPYPHKEGVVYTTPEPKKGKEIPEIRKNPFEALKDWKNRHSGGKSS